MHYDQDTMSILIDNTTVPDVCSTPTNTVFFNKKITKMMKNHLKPICEQMDRKVFCDESMSIGFLVQNDPLYDLGTVHKWALFGDEKYIVIIDKTKIYQKGLYFWVYITGILNDRDDN